MPVVCSVSSRSRLPWPQFTGLPGVMVPIEETIKGFNAILDGEVDDLPEQAFLNVGTIEEAKEKAKKLLEAAAKA